MKNNVLPKIPTSLMAVLAAVCVLTPMASFARKTATLTWQPSPDTTVNGYYFYYGTQSGKYTQRTDVGLGRSVTLLGLDAAATTLYSVVTSHNVQGDESDPSSEAMVVIPTPDYLHLKPILDQQIIEPAQLLVTNTTTGIPTGFNVSYSLDPGSPAGMSQNPNTGVLSWSPNATQTGMNNFVTVRVTDGVVTDAQAFKVTVNAGAALTIVLGNLYLYAPSGNWTIETSSDMKTWASGTVMNNISNWTLVGPASSSTGNKFYRARKS